MPDLTAIDLFAGAGGASCGLEASGYSLVYANDINPTCASTHRRNFPASTFELGGIQQLTGAKIMAATGLRRGELDLLFGGPPCQGFSIIGSRLVHDPRNDLFREFMRIAGELRPKAVVIENVPGLATFARGTALNSILDQYNATGYDASFAELLAAQYGVPQMRWRMILIGFRRDLGIQAGMGFPHHTHGRRAIGELIPNCTIAPEDLKGFVTTRDAIGDLPPLEAGEEGGIYRYAPTCSYQREMRRGAPRVPANHYAPNLSPMNLARIARLQPGQDWRDLPRSLLPEGMKRAKKKDHTRRYSRMTWDGIPRSIITRFRDPKSGEYTHPDQDRTISIREAARIQSFPDRFVFEGTRSDQYDQVGNAVPPKLAEAIGREIAACLEGSATHVLSRPFRRRPSIYQLSFASHLS